LLPVLPTGGCHTATHCEFSPDLVRPIEPLAGVAGPSLDPHKRLCGKAPIHPQEPGRSFPSREQVMRAEVAPPLAANMNAAFKKVRAAIGGPDDDALRELIVDRIVEFAKDGVYDIEELASRTLNSLKAAR
jgi:hypothetical protein